MNKVLLLIPFLIIFNLAGCESTNKIDTEKTNPEKSTVSMIDTPKVKTNYYDLPADRVVTLKSILRTNDLSRLDGASLEVLREYGKRKVLGTNPLNHNYHTSYFWHLYNALPDFVDSRERHHGYYRYEENSHALDEQLIAYAIYRLDRSPENLRRAFDYIKPYIIQMVPMVSYRHQRMDRIMAGLLVSHRVLTGIPDYERKLTSFWNEYYTADGKMKVNHPEVKKLYDGAYGFSAWELGEHISRHLGMDRYDSYYGSYWLSFWMRRHHEGNMDTVYRILLEIAQLYDYPVQGELR